MNATHKSIIALACLLNIDCVSAVITLTVVDNGLPDVSLGTVSDLEGPFQVAESFTTGEHFEITSLSWHGRYKNGSQSPIGADSFSFFIYSLDMDSRPDALLFHQELGPSNRMASGLGNGGSVVPYSYSAEVDGLTLDPGSYAYSIANDSSAFPEEWLIFPAESCCVGPQLVYLAVNGNWSGGNPGQNAVLIEGNAVPEPQSATLLVAALGSVLVGRRRRALEHFK